jgi:hypothetical protein
VYVSTHYTISSVSPLGSIPQRGHLDRTSKIRALRRIFVACVVCGTLERAAETCHEGERPFQNSCVRAKNKKTKQNPLGQEQPRAVPCTSTRMDTRHILHYTILHLQGPQGRQEGFSTSRPPVHQGARKDTHPKKKKKKKKRGPPAWSPRGPPGGDTPSTPRPWSLPLARSRDATRRNATQRNSTRAPTRLRVVGAVARGVAAFFFCFFFRPPSFPQGPQRGRSRRPERRSNDDITIRCCCSRCCGCAVVEHEAPS